MSTLRELMAATLVDHQRLNMQHCHCGWGELGRSHAEHQADAIVAAMAEMDRPPVLAAWDQAAEFDITLSSTSAAYIAEAVLAASGLRERVVALEAEPDTRIAEAIAIWESADLRVRNRDAGPGMFDPMPTKLPLADAADRMHDALTRPVVSVRESTEEQP